MGNTKLMTPLFYQDNFNADGKKMNIPRVRGMPISSMWSKVVILLRSA